MGRTSGTRVGKGAGHGGPAKGPGNHKAGPGRGNTHRSVAELMAAQGARETAADAWMKILRDEAHPKHADMVAKAAERLDGAPEQRFTGDVGPAFVIHAPARTDTIEEWEAQHKPKGQ